MDRPSPHPSHHVILCHTQLLIRDLREPRILGTQGVEDQSSRADAVAKNGIADERLCQILGDDELHEVVRVELLESCASAPRPWALGPVPLGIV